MKKKFLGRVLTMLLVASMVFTLLPASAIAAGNWWWNADEYTEEAVPAATADNSYQYNIFFLDCGRKYFSVNSIKALIDNASAAGFNYIQLAVGNDGLRLLLDDMALEVNGTTYDSDAVKTAIHAGNLAYNAGFEEKDGHKTYVPEKNELTQSEMNTIIAYANTKGMGVIPCVNTPGHMDAILSAANTLTGKNCSYNGSARTIDVTNATAVAFTKALLQKYIAYFQSQGCQLFNMGADEYANDKYATGSMGFGNLQSSGNYSYYVTYVNAVAAMIKAAKMTPMAFNDGIYFNNNTWSGTFDTDIIICYWSNGWSGYTPMPAATLADMGFKLVNTNGAYYWVLGKADAQCDATKAAQFNYLDFPRGKYDSSVSESAGSMFCIWADYPGDETEASVISKTAETIKAFGGALPKLTPTQPDTGITITPEGGATGTTGAPKLDAAQPEQLKLTASEKVLWRWNSEVVNLTSADTAEETGTIALYTMDTLEAQSVLVTPLAAGDPAITVTTLGANPTTTKYPIEVVNSSAPAGETVELKVGADYTVKVVGANNAGEYLTENPAVATVTVTGKDAVPEKTNYPVVSPTYYEILGDNSSSWVKTKYFYSNDNGSNYYPVYAKRTSSGILWWTSYKYTLGYSVTGSSSNVNEIASYDTNSTSNQPTEIVLYGQPTVVSGTPASTTITFHGVAEGDTSVIIGGTTYNIKVRYHEQPVNVVLNQSTPVTVSGTLNAAGLNTDVATVSISTDGTTMTVTGVAEGNTSVIVGNTKYHITVSTEDLETVLPLKIEYWITNSPVQRSEGDTTNYFTVSATMGGIATQNGVEVTADTMIPKEGYKKDGGRTVYYWHCRLLDKEATNTYGDTTQKQTDVNGDDETTSGVAFTKVRYYESHWAVYTEENKWVNIEDNHQLVAYYMELINISNKNGVNELKINAADWGVKGDGSGDWGYNPEDTRCSVSIQVVYTGGDTNPAGTDAESLRSKTLVYYLDENTERGIGTMIFSGEQDYSIYKITAETGTMTSSESGTSVTVNSFTWADNALTVWGSDDETVASKSVTLANPTSKINYASPYDRLTWNKKAHNKNNAILLRVYVVEKKNEDSLTVHYLDRSDSDHEFYNYNITVNKGTYFNEGFKLVRETDPKKNHLSNHTVTNSSGQTRKAEINLLNVNAPAKYRYANFTCVDATRGADGKNVYLYYTFDNSVSFIADFGLPLTIKAKDLSDAFKDGNQVTNKVVNDAPKHGTAVFDDINIVYTPDNTFPSSSGDTFTVTYTGKNSQTQEVGSASFVINILPASNVLYEASFLEQGTETTNNWVTRYGWDATPFGDGVQRTQKLDTPQIFGFDPAYQSVTTEKGFWKASGLKAAADGTKSLTTSFYGNAIDVIGSCGPNTGRVMVTIKDAVTGNPVKSVLVETTYSAGDIAQVPLAHIELDAEKSYTAVIFGYAPRASAAKQQSARAPMLAASYYSDDSYDALTADLAAMGLNLSDVEVISAADAAAKTASVRRAPQAYALNTVDEGAADGATVTIDGFRVYRSASNDAYNKLTNEHNVTYQNILDVMEGQVITAYIDGKEVTGCAVSNYEKSGGPQDEIYLAKNQTIAFELMKADGTAAVGQEIQISLSAVSGAPKYNGEPISSTMEMYYTFTANNEGVVSITNNGDGVLAIGNVKVPAGYTTVAPDSIARETLVRSIRMALNAAPETPDTVFEPTISAKVTTTRFIRSKVVTLTVSASADVAKLTVNGKELRPTNGWLVSMGWSKSYNYILTETVKRSETRTYEIIGYSADGTASTPTVVTSK